MHNGASHNETQRVNSKHLNEDRLLIGESHAREGEASGKRSASETAASGMNPVADSTVMNIDTPAKNMETLKKANMVKPSADFSKFNMNQERSSQCDLEFDVFTFKKKSEDVA